MKKYESNRLRNKEIRMNMRNRTIRYIEKYDRKKRGKDRLSMIPVVHLLLNYIQSISIS